MNKVELLTKVNRKITKLQMKGRKYSPEILLALGIAGVVTGTVLACVATKKTEEIKEQKENALDDMHARLDQDPDDITEETHLAEIKKETTAIYLKTGVRYAALYAPTVLVTGLSVSCLVFSNVILRRRLIGVSAAYMAISTSFKEYRGRVAERYGDEIEREIRYNIKPVEVDVVTTDAKGKEKIKKETIKVVDPSSYSDFARIYDDGNIGWTKDPHANMVFLKCQQVAATQRLKHQKYLFINDVYEMLGFPKTKEGQVTGWVYDEEHPIGDNFVDFGIYDITKAGVKDFVNGYERSIVLDFNHDGNILEFI